MEKNKKAATFKRYISESKPEIAVRFSERGYVKDGNIITSQGPGTAMFFALAIVEELCGAEVAEDLRKDLILK